MNYTLRLSHHCRTFRNSWVMLPAKYLRCVDPSFLLSVEVLQTVLEVTKPLSVKRQGVSQDILRTTESVRDCVDVLRNFRSGDMFDRLFVQAEEVDDRPIQMPRIRNRQRQSPNLPADSALMYYRRVLFNPFMDICVVQLQERFASTCAKALLFCASISASVWRGTSPQLRKG